MGTLQTLPARTRKDLLATPVYDAIEAMTAERADEILVAPIDPDLADTAAFCEAYQVGLDESANCVVVSGKRDGETRFAACLVLATTRADVNGIVRKLLDVRKPDGSHGDIPRPGGWSPAERLPADLATWPAWTPGEEQLGELELITSGAFAPLTGYLTTADLAAVSARGELADGTPWPLPVTLTVQAAAVPADADRLVLQDQEGSPLAVVSVTEHSPAADGTMLRLAGPVTALRAPEHGPFRALRAAPAEVRAALGRARDPAPGFAAGSPGGNGGRIPRAGGHRGVGPGGSTVLAYATRRPLGQRQIGQLRHLAGQLRARILLLPLVAGPADLVTRPESLVRAVMGAAERLPASTVVVPAPLPPRADASEDLLARAVVAAAYGATHLLADSGGAGRVSRSRSGESDFDLSKLGITILAEGEWAYDPAAEVWRPLGLAVEQEGWSGASCPTPRSASCLTQAASCPPG